MIEPYSRDNIRKRDDLCPLDRAVSDTLDEYLIRIHGITTSWAHPCDFILWLQDRGYQIYKMVTEEEMDNAP